VKRRKFITLLGGAAVAWPLAVRAQQTTMPVIGILHLGAPEANATVMAAFRQGLAETDYAEGKNVAIEYRWAEGQVDRLPALAADLVRRRVAVIVTPGSIAAALAAKAATTTIPIVFNIGADPVETGLVASLNKPGGNVTGVSYMNVQLGAKRLGMLHELLPTAKRFAVLVNPNNPTTNGAVAELQAAAASIGREIEVIAVASYSDLVPAFASLVQKRANAFLINPDQMYYDRRIQLLTLAARHAVPTIYALARVGRSWWADELRIELYGPTSPSRHLYRPHPQRRESGRPTDPARDQVRVGHQPANGQGAGHRHFLDLAHPRRRSD
jgi:putative tryptophan/tyrosine transport system substrate-binding protein